MRIGDKVRLLRGTEEGYIVSIKGNIVEVEIEDGFTIPAVKNEIVIIDKKEAETFRRDEISEEVRVDRPERQSSIAEGVYLGVREADVDLNCSMINQTSNDVLFSISMIDKKYVIGLFSGKCDKFQAIELGEIKSNPDQETIQFVIQMITHEERSRVRRPSLDIVLPVSKTQIKNKVNVHALDAAVAIFRLDESDVIMIDPEMLKENMTGSATVTVTPKDMAARGKDQTIDLHIEPKTLNLRDNEILRYQLELFEKSFDNALLTNARQLKVIHGIGSGKLRNEIHKRLSQSKEVKFYEDSDKERFGFGSTIIYF
jgi:hypothetical protein